MPTRSVSLPGPAVELPALPRALADGMAIRPERYTRDRAANDTLSTRPAPRLGPDSPAQAHAPNLSISAWYAISGTAMA